MSGLSRRDSAAGSGDGHGVHPPAGSAEGRRTGGDILRAGRPIPATASPFDALPDAVRGVMDKPFTGDFDDLVKRRAIRVGVTFNRTHYFIDRGQERGITFEALKSFESDLNTDLKTATSRCTS
jgi:hypothetical protein